MYENFKEVSEEEFLAHFGIPGMKWGKRKGSSSSGNTSPRSQRREASKQKEVNIRSARGRLQEGKSLSRRFLNHESFGRPLGGRKVLELVNKGSSKEDVAMAATMTRGEKAALGITAGLSIALLAASRR